MQKLVIIGGSNAFWEISELISDINQKEMQYEIVAVLDDNPSLIGKKYGSLKVEGPIERAREYGPEIMFVFAIGSFRTRIIRQAILERLGITDERFVTLIHPSAKIFSTANIGNGCIIHYGTVIFNHSIVESFVVIAANCVIAVSNFLGKGSLFGSNITTTTGVKVGSFSFIGSSTSIGEHVIIGPGAQIGMGSLILKNIPEGAFVLGNPPKMLDKIIVPQEVINEWEAKLKNL